jgi:hypothetical protein
MSQYRKKNTPRKVSEKINKPIIKGNMSDSDNSSNNVTPKAKRTRRKFSSDEERQEARRLQRNAYARKYKKTEKGKEIQAIMAKRYEDNHREERNKRRREYAKMRYQKQKEQSHTLLMKNQKFRDKPPVH